MNTSQWPQNMVMKPMEEMDSKERRVRPHREQASNCPRCNSNNTKFCYYNNYSLSQPRFFCKTCRRYWTEGGSLRNVPVGGGSRKNKRSRVNSSKISSSPQIQQDPSNIHDKIPRDLNFSIIPHEFKAINDLIQAPSFDRAGNMNEIYSHPSSSTSTSPHQIPDLELMISRGMSPSFTPNMPIIDPDTVYSSGFSLPEFRSPLSFSLDGQYESFQEASGKILFPYQDLNKQVSSNSNEDEHDRDKIVDSTGYWNGMMSNFLCRH